MLESVETSWLKVKKINNTATVEQFKLDHVLMHMQMKENIYNHLRKPHTINNLSSP